MKTYTNKEQKAWELTSLWYSILSETTNVFITMTKKQETEWESKFTYNNLSKYTCKELDAEIEYARALLAKLTA